MSMLSVQIDELRNAARGQKAMGLFELAQMLNDAADTIWQLRDDLQRTNAENAKLRERAGNLFNAVFAKNNELIDLLCENEKLRELVRDMGELLDVLTECDLACRHYHDGCIGDCYYVNARRELGVEVDDGREA